MDIINNLSYTNKDFGSIYPELLDLTKKLTNKWDPTISNESDPGVVLLKENAIIADKSNYNIDKNILEVMPASVTQQGNAMELYDFSGYHMHWYKSATTNITVTYNGELAGTDSFVIPRFTMVSNDNNSIVYTLNREIAVDAQHRTNTVPAIQGIIADYEVNGVTDITLANLDADLRLYFSEKMIAENGIFISNINTNGSDWGSWSAVENLESTVLNSKVYKFGVVPNSNVCYIQFPQDIAGLIGGGIRIKYIISRGESGNIAAYEITSLYGDITPNGWEDPINDETVAVNSSSAMDGSNPESLDDAYNNYKKTIGTFNTLVTCRDYANAVYNLKDNGEPYVSNCVVSDRTNDINNSDHIMSLQADGVRRVLNVKSDREQIQAYTSVSGNEVTNVYVDTPKMSAYDIALYILSPMKNIYSDYYYDKSFSPATTLPDIEEELSLAKSSQHNYYNNTSDVDTYIYKNFYTLTGKVVTFYKVTAAEASDIELNIKTALIENFNARQVNFGEEVSYEEIIDVIRNSDTRIKTVILNEPEYRIRKMLYTDTSGKYISAQPLSDADCALLVSRMVLNGTVQLYKFDEDFNYEFGQSNTNGYKSVSSIDTEVLISTADAESGYALKDNENIQIYAPNFITTTDYTAYVKYTYVSSTANEPTAIPDNTEYQLREDETINVSYTDANNTPISRSYGSGTIVRVSGFGTTGLVGVNDNTTALTANQSISIREINSTVFNEELNCIWYTNKVRIVNNEKEYILFDTDETEHILQNDEYFMYTNNEREGLIILGSGTKVSRERGGSQVVIKNQVDVSKVLSDGESAIDNADWYTYNGYSSTPPNPITVTELQIVTLAKGAQFKGEVTNQISNTPQLVTDPSYRGVGETTFTPLNGFVNIPNAGWKVVSRLNINATTITPQLLGTNQQMTLHYMDGDSTASAVISSGKSILFSTSVYLSGGVNLDTLVLTSSGEYTNSLSAYTYDAVALPTGIERDSNGYIKVDSSDSTTVLEFDFKTVSEVDTDRYCYLIPVIKNGNSSTVTISNCTRYLSQDAASMRNQGTYYLKVNPAGVSSISISWNSTSNDFINIGKIFKLNGYSDQVIASTVSPSDVMENIASIDTNNLFDYTYKIDEIDGIDTVMLGTQDENNVIDARAFWDINHICNRFTIPQMNLSSYNIKVSNSSRL